MLLVMQGRARDEDRACVAAKSESPQRRRFRAYVRNRVLDVARIRSKLEPQGAASDQRSDEHAVANGLVKRWRCAERHGARFAQRSKRDRPVVVLSRQALEQMLRSLSAVDKARKQRQPVRQLSTHVAASVTPGAGADRLPHLGV
jgi:hypothetical protein